MAERIDQDPTDELEQFDQPAPMDVFDDEDEPQAPVMVRIRLKGKTLEVTEEQAAIIEEHEAERQRVISRMGTELGELRKQPHQAPQQAPEPAQDEEKEFWLDPTGTVAKRIREAEERAYQRMREDQAREQAQQKFWGKFYADNSDLADHEDVVQFLVQKHYDDLKDLTPAECHQELAKRANAFLGRSKPSGKTLPNRPAQSERAAPTAPAAPRPAPTQPARPPMSLSARLIEARKEARRKAKYNIKDSDK